MLGVDGACRDINCPRCKYIAKYGSLPGDAGMPIGYKAVWHTKHSCWVWLRKDGSLSRTVVYLRQGCSKYKLKPGDRNPYAGAVPPSGASSKIIPTNFTVLGG